MRPALRWILLLLALALTLGAVFMDGTDDEAATAQIASPLPPEPTVAGTVPERGPVARMQPTGPNLFAVRETQPRPPVKKLPPPPPAAPPLPFRYQGKVIDDGQVIAFLAEGTRTHIVREGDLLSRYRVEEISPTGMTLVYLPLNEKQQLLFGSPSR